MKNRLVRERDSLRLTGLAKLSELKNDEAFTFEFNGVEVTNPNLDETGRFFVLPEEYYGHGYTQDYGAFKYTQIEEILFAKGIECENMSSANDLCLCFSIAVKNGHLNVYVPNSLRQEYDNELFNTYTVEVDEYEVGMTVLTNEEGEESLEKVVELIVESVKKYS